MNRSGRGGCSLTGMVTQEMNAALCTCLDRDVTRAPLVHPEWDIHYLLYPRCYPSHWGTVHYIVSVFSLILNKPA